MDQTLFLLLIGLLVGGGLGYFARLVLVKRRAGSLEARLDKLVERTKAEAEEQLLEAKKKAVEILEEAKSQEKEQQARLTKIEELLLKREESLERRAKEAETAKTQAERAAKEADELKTKLKELETKKLADLERISGLSREKAREEIFAVISREHEAELADRLRALETKSQETLQRRAQEIITGSLQRYAGSVVSEVTTTYVDLPSEELKGRIIGKEGRNIKTLERLTGVDIVVDETPDSVMISSFDPIRRQVAKTALEDLIKDGRIQPARIEEAVEEAKKKVEEKVKEAGEAAVYDVGLAGLDPRLVQLLGRLRYRTSFGQNVLLHSIEAAHIAGMIASELGADVIVAKKAALFHDIGKAIDHEVPGTHIEIGRRILQKFGVDEAVVKAMQAHHGDYPFETPEAVIVQVAEAISASRPGARKDTVEVYLKRLEDIERIVSSFEGVEKSYAIQAGREVRVFVEPTKISDLEMRALAKQIATRLEQELRYPGEIKVSVIRETRVFDYAR